MQNLSDFYYFSNNSYDYLAVDKALINAPKNNLTYGLLIFLIQYTLLLPIVFLCWIFMLRFLRSHGYISQVQADELVETIHNIPVRDIQRFTQIPQI